MRNLERIRPEDFDVERLLAAAREGRLYVVREGKSVNKEEIAKEVLAYVARIRVFVTLKFRSSVDELWEDILGSDDFIEFLMPNNKMTLCFKFNKYSVMRIVSVLREHGVYEQYSDRRYDALFEPDVKDSIYRKYLGKGIEQRKLVLKIREILAKYKI